MGALLGNMGVEMALTANEQERRTRRLRAGDIVILHRGSLNMEVSDVRLESELEETKKRIDALKERQKIK